MTTINITGLNLTNRKWYGNEDIETNENFQLKNERNTLIIYPEVTPKEKTLAMLSHNHTKFVESCVISLYQWMNGPISGTFAFQVYL